VDNNVRIATAADEEPLYDVLIALHEDNTMGIAYSPERVRAQMHAVGGWIGVIDADDGRIAATIGVFPQQLWYSDEWLLSERWLFVRTEYRQLGLDDKLFEFAKQYRTDMSARIGSRIELLSGCTSDKRLAAKIRLWSRWGRQIGALFLVDD
jgi:hypothetical protein